MTTLPFPFTMPPMDLDLLADIMFGDKTGVLDEGEGSKSESINEVGKDELVLKRKPGEKVVTMHSSGHCFHLDGAPPLDYYERLHRAKASKGFISHYQFAYGKKICIPLAGKPIVCPSDKCFDSTWVGVHGMQSICIITCRDMDTTRLHPSYHRDCMKQQNMRMFTKAIISEVECLPHKDVDYYDAEFRRLSTDSAKKPFSVVSLSQRALEEFGYPYEVKKPVRKGINYLQSAPSEWLHTHYGIIRVAITAYQIICNRKLTANDIWVTIWDTESGAYRFDHLPMDIIADQLDIINVLSSEKVPQKPLFEYRGPV